MLEVAAQMSHVSRELAQVYSDSAVNRARDFLTARQQEIADFNARIDEAKAAAVEIRRWAEQVELDEAVALSQLDRLRDELSGLLPELLSDTPEPAAAIKPQRPRLDDDRWIARLPRAAE